MRKNGMGPNNEGAMTGRGLGSCNGENLELQGLGRKNNGNELFCGRNFNLGQGLGQRRRFFSAGLSEHEVYQAKKANLEKELVKVNDKLKEFQK